MQKTISDNYLASRSIFTLVITLVLVYIAFFSVFEPKKTPLWDIKTWVVRNEEKVLANSEPAIGWVGVKVGSSDGKSNDINTDTQPVKKDEVDSFQTQSFRNSSAASATSYKTPTYIVSTQQLFVDKETQQQDDMAQPIAVASQPLPSQILYLSWTHHRVGVMKSAKYLGISSHIQYILKNNDNTHFAYLGKELPEVADALPRMGWKSLAITDKNDIHTHWLFGDKVIFLLVPQYIGKKQLFFVYFAEARDRWFVQVDTEIFETTKPLLRELFTKRYNR